MSYTLLKYRRVRTLYNNTRKSIPNWNYSNKKEFMWEDGLYRIWEWGWRGEGWGICKLLLCSFWSAECSVLLGTPIISHWHIVYISQPTSIFLPYFSIRLRVEWGEVEGDKGEKTKAREISREAKGADGETTTGFIWHGSHKVWGDCRETMSDIIEQLE